MLESSDDAGFAVRSELGRWSGNGTLLMLKDPHPTQIKRFYRVREQ